MESVPLKILLADDDMDDCEFFKEALDDLTIHGNLTILHDGILLMKYLNDNNNSLPDVLFLDINMPCKNGHECLIEIKNSERLKHIPVIIISTSMEEEVVKMFYANGAHNYIRKPANFSQLKIIISDALLDIQQHKVQPALEKVCD